MKTVKTPIGIIEVDDNATAADIQSAIDKRDPIKQQGAMFESLQAEIRAAGNETIQAISEASQQSTEAIKTALGELKTTEIQSFDAEKVGDGKFHVVLNRGG